MVSLTLDARTVYSLFKGYILKWIWPSRYYTAHLASIFEESRAKSHRAANHVKCQASDIMAMMPILAQFTSDILLPSGVCTRECQTFLKFCDMAEFITSVNRGGVLHTQISDTVHSSVCRYLGRVISHTEISLAPSLWPLISAMGNAVGVLRQRAVPQKSQAIRFGPEEYQLKTRAVVAERSCVSSIG